MKPKFIFKPVVSKAKMFLQALLSASRMGQEKGEQKVKTVEAGKSGGHPCYRKRHTVSKQERDKRKRIHRLSTRKR